MQREARVTLPNFKTYILTYTVSGLPRQDDAIFRLENFLRYNVAILGFWNYIPLVYCVKSRLHSSQLRHLLAPILETQYLLAEINPANLDGQLPQAAWDWFYAPPEERSFPGLGSLGSAFPALPSEYNALGLAGAALSKPPGEKK
jgi:hypothetical protein